MSRATQAVNIVTTSTGRTRAVCEFCGRMSRPIDLLGRPFGLYDLAAGWWMAPYSDSHQHADGSTGSLFTCPTCAAMPRPLVPRAYLETTQTTATTVESSSPSRGRQALTAGGVRSGFAKLVREFRSPDDDYDGMPCTTPTTAALLHDRAVTLVLFQCPACRGREIASWCRSCTRYSATHTGPRTCGACGHDAPESDFRVDASPLEARCGA